MIKVGIIGATGYTGAELVRLLLRHGEVEIVSLTSRTHPGEPFWRVYPHLKEYVPLACENLDLPALVGRCDVIFTALPHGHAMEVAREVVRQGKRLIDLGADFRLRDPVVYERWYGTAHTAADLLPAAVYGLSELYRDRIREARLVANPGCYPTASLLALAPLLRRGLIDPAGIVIDAKSGVSGAGRKLDLRSHFGEVNENIRAYGVASHRHTPEIEQELGILAGRPVTVSFTPHLIPVTRGILATIYAPLTKDVTTRDLLEVCAEFYAGTRFVRVLPEGMWPQTKAVLGSNHCDLGAVADGRTRRTVLVAAIDNLVKGASGQAVQNMNIMFGVEETAGLSGPGIYP
ncbi:MAG: N-acetyl-gamma-glutamyl-phosphate reductase [Bacillota bacterium]